MNTWSTESIQTILYNLMVTHVVDPGSLGNGCPTEPEHLVLHTKAATASYQVDKLKHRLYF